MCECMYGVYLRVHGICTFALFVMYLLILCSYVRILVVCFSVCVWGYVCTLRNVCALCTCVFMYVMHVCMGCMDV